MANRSCLRTGLAMEKISSSYQAVGTASVSGRFHIAVESHRSLAACRWKSVNSIFHQTAKFWPIPKASTIHRLVSNLSHPIHSIDRAIPARLMPLEQMTHRSSLPMESSWYLPPTEPDGMNYGSPIQTALRSGN